MTRWRAISAPWWTMGRWCHAWIGFATPIIAEGFGGHAAVGWASVLALVIAAVVQASRWRRPDWMFSDVVDLAAFVCGWLIGLVVCVV